MMDFRGKNGSYKITFPPTSVHGEKNAHAHACLTSVLLHYGMCMIVCVYAISSCYICVQRTVVFFFDEMHCTCDV